MAVGQTESEKEIIRLKRQLSRERKARIQAEEIAEHATRELYEKNLDLNRANRDLEQFAYIASHDLQEPLRMVSSFTQLLAKRYRGRLDKDADDFIAFAVDGARRMQGMINDLLAYSRVGRPNADIVPVDANEAYHRAISNLTGTIEESAADITHDALPVVRAGNAELARLFQNLLGNAIKFRGDAPPKIHIAAVRDGAAWRFSVRDNGIGMPMDNREKIFDLFKRLGSREKYPGSGLGLAIAKRIVERSGGRIWVESEPGRGSIFFFTLPASDGGCS